MCVSADAPPTRAHGPRKEVNSSGGVWLVFFRDKLITRGVNVSREAGFNDFICVQIGCRAGVLSQPKEKGHRHDRNEITPSLDVPLNGSQQVCHFVFS